MIYKFPNIPYDKIRELPVEKKPKGNPGRKKRPTYKGVVCALDIETTAIRKIKQSVMYIWQLQIGFEITIIGRYWPEFKETLRRIQNDIGDCKLVTYVHNLSYEFQFLSGIWDFSSEDVFCTDPRQILRADMGPLELRCSYRLSNMSLLEFTTQMKAEHRKLSGEKFDYSKSRWPWTRLSRYELEYAVNDVIGLVESVTQLMINDNDTLYTVPMTSTGYVRRDIKRAMKTYNWESMRRLIPPFSVHLKLKEGFRGGNTHANRHFVGIIKHHVKSFDMASAYPSAQVNKEFPMGRWYEINPEKVTLEYLDDLINRRHKAVIMECAFLNIRLQDPRWPVPYLAKDKCRYVVPLHDHGQNVSYDNGRILAAESLVTTITDIDLKIICSEYAWDYMEVKYLAFSTYGKLPPQYREVVLDYYHKKTTLKGVAGSEWLYMKSKNKTNSIYGCSVQDPIQLAYMYQDGMLDEEGELTVPYALRRDKTEEELYNDYTRFACMSYAWGVWTTCYCRERLEEGIRLIYETGEEQLRKTGKIITHFIYADTDSLKFVGPCDFEQINTGYRDESVKNGASAVDPKGITHYLGVYEYEGEYADFITWGAKKYAYREESDLQTVAGCGDIIHITIAGVNKIRGARELEKRGGLQALLPDDDGRPHFIFEDAGGTDAIYNDYPEVTSYKVGNRTVKITRNLYLEQGVYTLGITTDFARIISHPDLWRDLLDAKAMV